MFGLFRNRKKDSEKENLIRELTALKRCVRIKNDEIKILRKSLHDYRRDYVLPLAKSVGFFSSHMRILNDLDLFRIGDEELLKKVGEL